MITLCVPQQNDKTPSENDKTPSENDKTKLEVPNKPRRYCNKYHIPLDILY